MSVLSKLAISLVILLSGTLHTKASNAEGNAFGDNSGAIYPTLNPKPFHGFLHPQYRGVFTGENLADFVTVLRNAVLQGDHTYFQDPRFNERFPAHCATVLGGNYPGNPASVINGLQWVPANQFTGRLEMGMLTPGFERTEFKSIPYANSETGQMEPWPRVGEMLGMYGDIPIISTYCGNLTRGQYIPNAPPPPPPPNPATGTPATNGAVNVYVYNGSTNNATATNSAPLGASNMGGYIPPPPVPEKKRGISPGLAAGLGVVAGAGILYLLTRDKGNIQQQQQVIGGYNPPIRFPNNNNTGIVYETGPLNPNQPWTTGTTGTGHNNNTTLNPVGLPGGSLNGNRTLIPVTNREYGSLIGY